MYPGWGKSLGCLPIEDTSFVPKPDKVTFHEPTGVVTWQLEGKQKMYKVSMFWGYSMGASSECKSFTFICKREEVLWMFEHFSKLTWVA